MSDPYVIFPGTTDHVSTDDINLFDADTAHLVQSIGEWEAVNTTITDEGIQPDGWGQIGVVMDHAEGRIFIGNVTEPVVENKAYTFSCDIDNRNGVEKDLFIRMWVENSAQAVGDFTAPPGVSRQFQTITLPAGYITHIWISDEDADVGDDYGFSKFCFVEGSDPTFYPSLRIVGDLFEDIEPADMPIVFAGDGTPLTVGEGWAGNGYHYRRYDGPDDTAPIVAQFDAADVPQPAQLPI